MKNFLGIIVIVSVIWGVTLLLKGDDYKGFFYPDASDLLKDIQSPDSFRSLEECRDWVHEQVSRYNPDGSGYDYECGKNCKPSGGKPYVCEETLE